MCQMVGGPGEPRGFRTSFPPPLGIGLRMSHDIVPVMCRVIVHVYIQTADTL